MISQNSIKHDVADGRLDAFEDICCAICGSSETAPLSFDQASQIQSVICKTCSLVFANPRPTAKSYREFYKNVYWQIQRNSNGRSLRLKIVEENSDSRVIEFVCSLSRWISQESQVLDIGCGFGATLNKIQQCYGCSVTGIEPNTTTAALIKKEFGLNIFSGTLEEFHQAHKDKKFDFIILHHVLEHFANPNVALKIISVLLSEHGYLYIAIPNLLTTSVYATTRHPYVYSPWTIFLLLQKYGFKISYFTTNTILKKGMDLVATPIDNSIESVPFKKFLYGYDWQKIIQRHKNIQSMYRTVDVLRQAQIFIPKSFYKFLRLTGRLVYRRFGL